MMLSLVLVLTILPYLAQSACPTIISRSEWGAMAPRSTAPLRQNPPPYVVVHHTDSPGCTSVDACKTRVKNTQSYHMDKKKGRGWDDIGYNFLVGGDGNVYEGRGWGKFGSHVPRFNAKSIGISVIGDFENDSPSQTQLDALKDLIACGTENNYIKADYHLIGHRQGKRTTCPGQKLYDEISTWPNFDSSIRP